MVSLSMEDSRCRSKLGFQNHRARRGGPTQPAPAGAAALPLRGPSEPGPRQAARRAARGHGGGGGGGGSARRPPGVGGAARPGCEPGGHGECGRCGERAFGWVGAAARAGPRLPRSHSAERRAHALTPAPGRQRPEDAWEFEASHGYVGAPATKHNTPSNFRRSL